MNDSLEHIYGTHHNFCRGEGFSIFERERGEFFRKTIGRGKEVLDVGCRDGALTKYFIEHNKVLGVDIDKTALERARKEFGIEITHTDLNSAWDFPKNNFDAVVAAEVIEHLYHPEVVLEKIISVLKPTGVLVGSVPNAFSLKNRVRLFLGRKKNTPLADPTHINHFSRRELEDLLRSHFSQVVIYPIGSYAFLDKVVPGMFSFMLMFEARNKK